MSLRCSCGVFGSRRCVALLLHCFTGVSVAGPVGASLFDTIEKRPPMEAETDSSRGKATPSESLPVQDPEWKPATPAG